MDKQQNCFANYHMTLQEFAVWTIARSISHQWGKLLFDGRTMAERFDCVSKSACYRAAETLTKKGWFEVIDFNVDASGRRKRDSHGHFLPTVYRVLSHEEWVKKCGAEKCHNKQVTCPKYGNGRVPSTGMDVSQVRDIYCLKHIAGLHTEENHLSIPPVPSTGQVIQIVPSSLETPKDLPNPPKDIEQVNDPTPLPPAPLGGNIPTNAEESVEDALAEAQVYLDNSKIARMTWSELQAYKQQGVSI